MVLRFLIGLLREKKRADNGSCSLSSWWPHHWNWYWLAMHGAPLYIAETCPSQIRGTLISLKELRIVLGILLGYLVGSMEIDVLGGWRYMYALSAPSAILMMTGMWSLPPSPRWLLLRAVQGKGSIEENTENAIYALGKLRGRQSGDKVSEKEIKETLTALESSYAEEEPDGSLFEVFQGASLKAFTIGGGLVLFQQITGQPSVLYFAASILQRAGLLQSPMLLAFQW